MESVDSQLTPKRREVIEAISTVCTYNRRFTVGHSILLRGLTKISPFWRDTVMTGASLADERGEAERDYYHFLMKGELDRFWVLGQFDNSGPEDAEPEEQDIVTIKIPFRSNSEFDGLVHFLIDRGSQEERFGLIGKAYNQIRAHKKVAKRFIIGEPEDVEIGITKAYVEMLEYKKMIDFQHDDVLDFDALRRKMILKKAGGANVKVPKYLYLFVYDYDYAMSEVSDVSKRRFLELVEGGAKYGVRIVASTSERPEDVLGSNLMTNIMMEGTHEDDGEYRAFITIKGEIKLVDTY